MQTNLDLFDPEQITDIAYSKCTGLTDISNSEESSYVTPPFSDIGYSDTPKEHDVGNEIQPSQKVTAKAPFVTGDAWCNAVLEQAIALKTGLKDLQADPVQMVEVLDAISYVAAAKRDRYAEALTRPADESLSFGWIVKTPELARHVALLNLKRIDLFLIPMLPAATGH